MTQDAPEDAARIDAPRDARSNAGARQRRRGLYGPPARLTRTSPLTGRLVWHIGDWGRASEHIGARWEQVAGPLAREQLGPGDHLIVLAGTPALMAEVLGSGLPHADALRTWREDDHLALEPLDFKWSLETASARQVSSETLERLLAAELHLLDAALREARLALGLAASAALEPGDGRFVAPVHPANQAALADDPELPTLLLPVDPRAFFEPLPGWAAARTLARLESSDLDRLSGIEAIERYYRLGAGVEGALSRLRTGLFDGEPAKVDAPVLIGELRQAGKARTLNALLLYIQNELANRKALEERLALLPRTRSVGCGAICKSWVCRVPCSTVGGRWGAPTRRSRARWRAPSEPRVRNWWPQASAPRTPSTDSARPIPRSHGPRSAPRTPAS